MARHLRLVTDRGKVLGPFADHMTQITMVICVAAKNKQAVLILLSLLLVKEAVMVTLGGFVVKIVGAVNSAPLVLILVTYFAASFTLL